MGLRFVIGRSRSGKTSFCLNEIKEKQRLGKRLIYIVPEQYSLQAEKELVAVAGGIVSAAVLSFRRLAENIFSEKGGISGKLLDDTGKLIILRHILNKNKDKLKYFGVVCSRQGFISRLGDTLSVFSTQGIYPEDIENYSKAFPEESAMALKLQDTALIYSEYREFIKTRYVSSDDMLTIAAQRMTGAKYIEGAEVWLDGFYGFTHQEYEMIGKMLSACKNVTVTLNMDPKYAVREKLNMENMFFEPWDTMMRLKKICSDKNISLEKNIYLTDTHYSSKGMETLEKEYPKWNVNSSSDNSGIGILTASTVPEEINMCASRIISYVRDKGLRYRDIAVTARTLDDYEENIRLIFSHYGIPFFMDTKRTVMGQAYTELLLSIVDMTADNLSYESVFRCLKTELTPLLRDERDILENYVVRYGIKGSEWLKERWQLGFENEDTSEKEDIINDIKCRAIGPFIDFYKTFRKGKHSVKEITVKLYEVIEAMNVAEMLSQKSENAENDGDLDKAQEYIRCFELISELLENMTKLLGDDEVSIKEYGEILQAGLGGLKMGIIPAGIDSVMVGDIERSRLPDIKALFVVGVNEGVIPSNNFDTENLFNEREISALEEIGAEMPHSGARLTFEEQYLIYMGITRPSDFLCLCRNKNDFDGRETRPSSIIGKIEKIFPEIAEEEFDALSLKSLDRPIPALHRLGEGFSKDSAIWQETADWLINEKEYRDRALMIKNGINAKNIEENLSRKNLNILYGSKPYTSVSRLETFAKCPFSYFAQYSLNAKPRKIYEIKTPDIGSIFHKVLEKIIWQMKEEGLTWQTISEERAKEITENIIDEMIPEPENKILLSTAAYSYLVKRIKRITGRAVFALRKHMKSGKFETFGSEITFGTGELPAIAVEMPDGRDILLRGKIDRVDIYRKEGSAYIKIIDYKSGSQQFSLSDIYYGLQLQLLLYMDAFIKTGKVLIKDEPDIGGVFYFRVMDPVIKDSELKGLKPEQILYKKFCMSGLASSEPDVLEALDADLSPGEYSDIISIYKKKDGSVSGSAVNKEFYKSLMDYTLAKAGEIGKNITDGDVSISPVLNGKRLPCDYCEYRPICCFDERNGNKQRKLKKLSADEVWDGVLSGKKNNLESR